MESFIDVEQWSESVFTLFNYYDQDHDGYVDQFDFTLFLWDLKSVSSKSLTKSQALRCWEMVDVKKKGQIDSNDFKRGINLLLDAEFYDSEYREEPMTPMEESASERDNEHHHANNNGPNNHTNQENHNTEEEDLKLQSELIAEFHKNEALLQEKQKRIHMLEEKSRRKASEEPTIFSNTSIRREPSIKLFKDEEEKRQVKKRLWEEAEKKIKIEAVNLHDIALLPSSPSNYSNPNVPPLTSSNSSSNLNTSTTGALDSPVKGPGGSKSYSTYSMMSSASLASTTSVTTSNSSNAGHVAGLSDEVVVNLAEKSDIMVRVYREESEEGEPSGASVGVTGFKLAYKTFLINYLTTAEVFLSQVLMKFQISEEDIGIYALYEVSNATNELKLIPPNMLISAVDLEANKIFLNLKVIGMQTLKKKKHLFSKRGSFF